MKQTNLNDLDNLHRIALTPEAKALEAAMRTGNSELVAALTDQNKPLMEALANLLATDEAELKQIKVAFPAAVIAYTSQLASSKKP